MLILTGSDVLSALSGRELAILDAVQAAYEAHDAGASSLPPSSFVRFPGKERERIIALPGYLGGEADVAGVKWIASFPDNVSRGAERASASILLNSTETGQPTALIEGSVISARRTAASAALAARALHAGLDGSALGVVGCGYINFEVVRFVLAALPDVERVVLYDRDPERARQFAEHVRAIAPTLVTESVGSLDDVFRETALVSFATTAVVPHVDSLAACRPGTTILHVSLRDLSADATLGADNVVDDLDHVCRARTSIHLAAEQVGHRDFVRATLADVTTGAKPPRAEGAEVTVFSPFGLGVLDLALAKMAVKQAEADGLGTKLDGFLPIPWTERDERPSVRIA